MYKQTSLRNLSHLRCVPICAVLVRCMDGFGGGQGVTLRRRFCALCGGCGGVLSGQSVQYAAAVFGQYSLLKEGLELFLRQRYGVGQQLLKKPHALAKAVCPVLALLLFLLLDQPLFLLSIYSFAVTVPNGSLAT